MEAQAQAGSALIAPPHDVRLMIAIPSLGTWKAAAGMSIMRVFAQCLTHPLSELRKIAHTTVYSETTHDLPNARINIVQRAQASGWTHILWVDADMVIPEDTAHCLLAHNLPVVAANYAMRNVPTFPTAHKAIRPEDTGVAAKHGAFMVTTHADLGLEEACLIGMGCCLTETSLFDKLPQPWFERRWSKSTHDGEPDHWMGEDKWLCSAVQEAGLKVMVDHELSNRVGHIGDFTYLNEHVQAGV